MKDLSVKAMLVIIAVIVALVGGIYVGVEISKETAGSIVKVSLEPPVRDFEFKTVYRADTLYSNVTYLGGPSSGIPVDLKEYQVFGRVRADSVSSGFITPGTYFRIDSIVPYGDTPWKGDTPTVGITDQPVLVDVLSE